MKTPDSDRVQRARIAAYALHATHDSREITAHARAAFLAGMARRVDPEGRLGEEERERRARAALRSHMAALALKSAQARRRRG
ncbi:MAG: hypothetical protein ACYCZN_13105 [Candidatus Dormibacteria bacterium]